MTTEGALGERPAGIPASDAPPQLLDLCDRVLGEIGRRRHRFAWLRAPGAEDWIPVDAYYPGNRLVVLLREPGEGDDDELIATRVPEHGLRVLWVEPNEMPTAPQDARWALERELAELGPAPERPRGVVAERTGPSPMAQAVTSLAQLSAVAERPVQRRSAPSQTAAVARAARFAAAHQGDAERAARAAAARQGARPVRSARAPTVPARDRRSAADTRVSPAGRISPVVALVLVAVLGAEIYFGVARWALAGGHLLLAFAIGFDACSRALGTFAAGWASDRPGSWRCALGGSPFVAGFVLFGEDGPVTLYPAPFAGLLSLAAMVMLAAACVHAVLGG